MFQSLFLWMTVVDNGCWSTSGTFNRFQSLFLWMTVVDRYSSLEFNRTKKRFQSLFLWMTVVDAKALITTGVLRLGFNPCSCVCWFSVNGTDRLAL